MPITCREMLKLTCLQELKMVAGQGGLDRPVRWVYAAEGFADIGEVAGWVHGGELMFITGLGLKGDETVLLELITRINARNVAGLVVNIGPYIQSIPPSVIELADKLDFPLFELPWRIRIVDVTRAICSAVLKKEQEELSLKNVLETILFGDSSIDEHLMNQAAYYGYDISVACRIGIFEARNLAAVIRPNWNEDEKAGDSIMNELQKIVQETFYKNSKRVLTLTRNDGIIILYPSKEDDNKRIPAIAAEVRKEASKRYKGLQLFTGIGKKYSEVRNLKKSYREAEQALRIAGSEQVEDMTCFYENLGIYSLLFEIKEKNMLESYYLQIMAPLLEYDKLNNADLMKTLEVFLLENCSATDTSERLFIHRNTTKYRLQKIEELTHTDLKNLQDCLKFAMAFKIRNMLKDLHGNN